MKTAKTTKTKIAKPTTATPQTSADTPARPKTDGALPAKVASASSPTEEFAVAPARRQTVSMTPAPAPAAASVTPRREITTELIAARAYNLWEQQGRPQGNEVQNWLLAESQLKQEIQSFTA